MQTAKGHKIPTPPKQEKGEKNQREQKDIK